MKMIGHQAVSLELEGIPQLRLSQRLQESAVVVIVKEHALPVIATIKDVETQLVRDHSRSVAHVGTLQNLRRAWNQINCSDTGFSLIPVSPGLVERHHFPMSRTTIDLDARRINDRIIDALVMQEPMEPETIAPGLVAGEDRRALGKTEPVLSASDLGRDPCGIVSRHGHEKGALATRGRRGEFPVTVAQLQSEIEHWRNRGGTIGAAGRCHE
jgi:hypothetical protein